MEDDLKRSIKSPVLTKPDIQRELERLKYAVDESQKRIDFTVANDPEIQKAIRVVERFLRRAKRVCYGGTAINMLVPENLRFYDDRYQIPDYDMFTPDVKGDVEELVKELEKEGFTDINEKIGIHEGTRKVLVNFIPIADFTSMNEKLFRVIYRRSHIVDGIHYCDPDFLRMMMYLELSRPRGQVERWSKVYERLTLLEKAHPMRTCRQSVIPPHIEEDVREQILSMIIKRKRVLAGIEAIDYYEKGNSKLSMSDLVKKDGVVVFFSPDAKHDGEDLKDILGHGVKVDEVKALADDFFDVYFVRYHRRPIALIVQERACHGYTQVLVGEDTKLRVASLDLLMNLYLSFVVFGKKEERFLQTPVLCLAELAHVYLKKYRAAPTKQVPAFTISCSGRQKGFASLQKERLERQKLEKGAKKGGRRTRKRSGRKGRGTRRY
jgi:Poly(A) polymerase catalytic subunit